LKINLTSWVLFEHDNLLKDRLKHPTELFNLLVFFDICFVVHRTEVSLEVSHVQDAFLLALYSSKGLPGSPLRDLMRTLNERSHFGIADRKDG
jgi:hypothetical protein